LWEKDRAHGFGIYYHTDGAKYEGDWFEDQQVYEDLFHNARRGKEKKFGRMERPMREHTKVGRKKAKGYSLGVMMRLIMASSGITTYMEEVNTYGRTRGCTKAIGSSIRCMDMASSHGQMARNILVDNILIF
jgi:hypothetical protein